MRQDQTIQIYQRAVDPTMGSEQGAQWWADVSAELDAVIAAADNAAAADIIAWWHSDWRLVGQNPKRVAGRIRRQAAHVMNG
ncbi:MAG: hypothetical protein K2X55_12325 [Burkholderiaceae bacterium]|nr:hypothetical protein [Burkholderiaceae bacterium]